MLEYEYLKEEFIKRLKILKLNNQIIDDFKNNDKVYATIIDGDTIEVTEHNKVYELMKSFEKNKQGKIYHIISIEGQFRSAVYILYVNSNTKDEWKLEQEDLKRGFAEVSSFEEIIKYDNRHIGIEVNDGKIKKVV